MTNPVVSRTTERTEWGPRGWFTGGLLATALGVIVGAIVGSDGGWLVFSVVAAIPGVAMVFIGLVGKAVQVGIRSGRD